MEKLDPEKAGCLHGCLSISGSGLPETFDRFVDDLFQLLEPLVHGSS